MAKLSFMERRRISRKNDCKLKEKIYNSKNLGISIWASEEKELWIVEDSSEEATKISKDEKKFMKFDFSENKEGKFFLGTEGLFYVDYGELEKVYEGDAIGARVMSTGNVIIVFQEEQDFLLQLNPNGRNKIEKKIMCKVKCFGDDLSREVTEQQRNIFAGSKERRIIVKEGEENYLYTINFHKTGLHKAKKV